MRTTQREGGYVTFNGYVKDAASGSGIAQPGNIPYTYTRTATGNYTVTVDSRITVLSFTVLSIAGMGFTAVANSLPPTAGSFGVAVLGSGGGNTNSHFHFTCTARDTR